MAIRLYLNERGRRLWAAAEAKLYERGDIALISQTSEKQKDLRYVPL